MPDPVDSAACSCVPTCPHGDACRCLVKCSPTMSNRLQPRAFILWRREDVSGVSGKGAVAQGVEFADGTVALRWLSDWPTSVVFHERGIEGVEAVHGHDGRTEVVWVDA